MLAQVFIQAILDKLSSGYVVGTLVFLLIFLTAIFIKKAVVKLLGRKVQETSTKLDDVILKTLVRAIVPFGFLVGLMTAAYLFPLPANIRLISTKVLLSLTIVYASWSIADFLSELAEVYLSEMKSILPAKSIFTNLLKLGIIIIGILILLQTLGVSITPLLTTLGIGGLAVALALQDTLANLFAGLHLILSGIIREGNYVRIEEANMEGYVVDITWRNTVIKTISRNYIVVPNTRMASSILVNYYMPETEMSITVPVGVSYDSDLEKVERVTIEVAKEVMREVAGLTDEEMRPYPLIRYYEFGESSINFKAILKVKEFSQQYIVKHEFIKRLHKRFQDEGIEIPFPIRTIIMKRNQS